MDIATLGITVKSDGADRAARDLDRLERSGQRAARGVATLVRTMGLLAGAASFVGVTRQISEFDSAMSKVQALSRATAKEFDALKQTALDLGSSTEFSASQAADALGFLSMAGFEASESMAALPAVLDLATASGMGLAESADIASNVLSGFGLAASDASSAADILAEAASTTNTSVGQLGRAMSTVAPISAALGISMEETAAAIGVMSDAGIQGERAGTALRGVLASIAGPTSQAQEALAAYGVTLDEINPETNSLAEIMATLGEAGLSTADAMTVFGREAASGALVMIEAASRMEGLTDQFESADGAAKGMADTMRDNLGGDMAGLTSAISGLVLALGDAGLTSVIRGVVQGFTELVRIATSVVNAVGAVINYIGRQISATEAVTEAMAEQERQSKAVKTATEDVSQSSRDAATAALGEAKARMAVIDAYRASRIELAMQSKEYQKLQDVVNLSSTELDMFQREQQRSGGQFAPLTAEAAENLNRIKTQLAQARTEQERLLQSAKFSSSEYTNLERKVKELEAELTNTANTSKQLPPTISATITAISNATVGANGLANALSFASAQAAQLAANLAQAPAGIAQFQARAEQITAQIQAIDAGYDLVSASAASYRKQLEQQYGLSEAASAAEDAYISGVINRQVAEFENVQRLNGKLSEKVKAYNAVGSAAKASGGSASSASKAATVAAETAIQGIEKEIKARRELLNITTLFEDEYQAIRRVTEALAEDQEEWSDAQIQGLADQIVELERLEETAQQIRGVFQGMIDGVSNAFGELLSGQLKGFGDFADKMLGMFQKMLGDMISMAMRNEIMIRIGAQGSTGGLMGGGGGLLGRIFGGGGGGGGGLLGGLFGGGGGGFLGTLGLIGGAIGIIGGLVRATRRNVKDRWIEGTFGADGFEGVENMREGGNLFGGARTKTKPLSDGLTNAIDRMFGDIRENAIELADDMGRGADALDDFTAKFRVNIMGLSGDELAEAMAGGMADVAEQLAVQILGHGVSAEQFEDVHQMARDLGGYYAALQQLSTGLSEFNRVSELLSHTVLDLSTASALTADSIIQAVGGLQEFTSAANNFFLNFYTEAERAAAMTDQLRAQFEALGVAMPATRAQFRALIGSIDISTEAGQELYAELLKLSGAFAQVTTDLSEGGGLLTQRPQQILSVANTFATGINTVADSLTSATRVVQDLNREALLPTGVERFRLSRGDFDYQGSRPLALSAGVPMVTRRASEAEVMAGVMRENNAQMQAALKEQKKVLEETRDLNDRSTTILSRIERNGIPTAA